mmetsp:Transcript_7973/g.26243  ORF Transcript_7973/g.26243 Transcript_7973/m.26243 type:complete len:216 (-) Transcript_7973:841-1488(-)
MGPALLRGATDAARALPRVRIDDQLQRRRHPRTTSPGRRRARRRHLGPALGLPRRPRNGAHGLGPDGGSRVALLAGRRKRCREDDPAQADWREEHGGQRQPEGAWPRGVRRHQAQHDGLSPLWRLDAAGCVCRIGHPLPSRLLSRLHGQLPGRRPDPRRHAGAAGAGPAGTALPAARPRLRLAVTPGLRRAAPARPAPAQAAPPVGAAAARRGDD